MLWHHPVMPRKPWLFALAACFAAIVNLNPYPLFLGVSLIFGMSIALMTLFLLVVGGGLLLQSQLALPQCICGGIHTLV